MRLICPNCGAQYEVADDVIPAAGRDVQCSNCGHTWFETPGASAAAEEGRGVASRAREPQPAPESAPESASVRDPEPDPEPAIADDWGDTAMDADIDVENEVDLADFGPDDPAGEMPAPSLEPEPAPEPEPADPVAAAVAAMAAPPAAETPTLRTMSPEIAEILREEAAREEAARAAERAAAQARAGGLESQPDLGLPAPEASEDSRADEVRRRTARLRGDPAPNANASRRELLPDIEEINSTLRSASDRQDGLPPAPEELIEERKRGFRFGFGSVLAIALVLAAAYVAAPRIIAALPQTAPVLSRYVDGVDNGRLWLDLQLQRIVAGLSDSES
ncbi:MAG: thioredoxin [Rhodobacterales bacterium]|nr:thioredoxin [Rhodobacterales bacterium]NCT12695.1 thioredoxin [Rhodobacterales bacterium]